MYTVLCAASLLELYTGNRNDCMEFARAYASTHGMSNFKLVNNTTRSVKYFTVTRFGFIV